MGCGFAPSFANLFIGSMEMAIYEMNLFRKVQIWKRYIDTIFGIWNGSTEELLAFVKKLNQPESNIQFTLSMDPNEINFLDITIFKILNSRHLSTKMFFKENSSLALIHHKSFHPKG